MPVSRRDASCAKLAAMPRLLLRLLIVSWSLLGGTTAQAQIVAVGDPISAFTLDDISESLISLGSFNVSPGVAGARVKGDSGSDLTPFDIARGSIEIPMWFSTPIDWLSVFAEVGYGSVRLETRFGFENTSGEQVDVHSEIRVRTGRIGLGVDFLVAPDLHITPFFLAAITGISSDPTLSTGPVDPAVLSDSEVLLFTDWTVNAWTVAGLLDVQYLPWIVKDKHRLDFTARYASLWSKSFNESVDGGSVSALRHTLSAEILWHVILRWKLLGRNLSPNLFTNATTFPGQDRDDLGFNAYFGVGAGIDLYSPKPLFGLVRRDFIGVRGAAVLGNGVRGWSVVASIRR